MKTLLTFLVFLSSLVPSLANHDARRLYDDLLQKQKYNKLVRPVGNHSAPVVVKLGLRFAQLIDVVGQTFSKAIQLLVDSDLHFFFHKSL